MKNLNRQAYPIAIIFLLLLEMTVHASSFDEKATIRSVIQPVTRNLHFNLLNSENGLSNNFITAVAQDNMGFLWFGSRYGLNKFDGMNVTVYTNEPNNPESIGNNYAWYLFVDSAGTLWVATWGGGLCRYDARSDSFTRYQHDENDPGSLGSDLVWYAYEDSSGTIWVATDGGGLNRLDSKTGKFKRYQHDPQNPSSISHMTVTQIVEDSSGSLWMGTYGGGLNKLDPETGLFECYQHDDKNPDSLSNNNIWSLRIDSNQRLWIGTEGGLNLYNPESEIFTHYKNRKNDPRSISHNTVLTIHEDQSGSMWIGTFGGGLNQFDPARGIFTRYRHRPLDEASLSDDTVYHIYEDRVGSMWIATENGVNRVDPGNKRFIHKKRIGGDPNSLSSNKVRAIHEGEDGAIWIGTEGGGLNRYDRDENNFRQYRYQPKNPDTLSSNSITSIATAPENHLWVGTEGGGLNRFDPQTGMSIRYQHIPDNPNSLSNDTIWDLSVDRQGQLWIVMDGGGLNRFDPEKEKFTHWRSNPNDPNSLVSDWALSVFPDSRGMIWIGTDSGLSRFDPEQNAFQNYLSRQFTKDQTENNSIFSIYEDKQGTIWIGTNDGLKRLNKAEGHITAYRERDGLAGNYVADIQEDHMGFLWISTNKGLSRLDPKTAAFRNYDKQDGLQGNYFLWGSGLRSRSNELYFGGINGITIFNPEKLSDNQFVPPVVLTDFQLFNKSVAPGERYLPQHISTLDRISLPYHQSVFTLEFAALNYRSPGKNQYAYRLEGFESNWNYIGSDRRYATYTNLDPGTYTFHVKATNNDGIWNEQGSSIKIEILPPWWETIWFKALIGVCIFIIIGGVVNYIRKLRYEIKERKIAQNNLNESEEKFRSFAEHSLVGIYLIKDSVFEYVNPKFADIFGYTVEECLDDMPFHVLVHPDDREQVQSRVSGEVTSVNYNFRGIKKDGEMIHVEIFGSSILIKGHIAITGTILDITDRKQAEKDLIEQRYFLHKAQEIGKIGTWDLDIINNDLLWTDENYRIFGIPIGSELTYEAFLNCVHPNDREFVDTEWKAAFTGKPYDIEHRILVDNEVKWVREKAELEYNDSGVCIRGTGFTQDITDQKEYQKSLHEHKLFLENISDIAYIADNKGNVTYINPAAEQITGLPINDIVGRSFLPLFVESDRQSLIDVYQKTLSGEHLENTLTFTSGITCHFTSLPLKGDDGNIIGTFGVARDISERIEFERALKVSAARLKKAQSVANIGNWEYDIQKNKIWGSEQAFKIYGIERTSPYLPLDKVEDCIFESEKVNRALTDLIHENKKYDIEYSAQRETDGRIILIHSIAELIVKEDVPIKVLGVIQDVTQQRQLEEQIQKAQRMESIGNLAGGIAHDFNNILFPIVGMSEMLMEDFPPGSMEHENAEEIFKAGKRGRDLVKQILAFSRQSEHAFVPVRLQKILEEVLKLTRSSIPSNIVIKQNIQKDCGLVNADSVQIHQVAMNLITNAYHAVEMAGGEIFIGLRETIPSGELLANLSSETGQYVELSVSDTGHGIEQDNLGKIFEPYFTTKDKDKGTGLGLATVYGIVKEHKGDITVQSQQGEGTTFRVFLPLLLGKGATKKSPLKKNYEGGTERILLVDDEESVAMLEKQMLERLGYRVTARTSSHDALETFRRAPDSFDLVMTDMTMPNMTGDLFAQELISIRPDIPVVVCTGFSEKIDQEKSDLIGIKGLLMKPIVRAEMAKMVRKVLDDVKS